MFRNASKILLLLICFLLWVSTAKGSPVEDSELYGKILKEQAEKKRPMREAEEKATSLAKSKTATIPLSIYDIEEIRLIPGKRKVFIVDHFSRTIPHSLLIKLKKPYSEIDSLSWDQERLEDLLAYLRLIQENKIAEIVIQTHYASPKDDEMLEWEVKPCNNKACEIRAWILRLDRKK